MPPTLARAPPGATDYIMLMTLGAIWGGSFILIKIAVGSVPPVPMMLIRLSLTALLMLGLVRWMGVSLPEWGRVWLYVALSALFGNALPFLLIAWGEERVDGGLAAILVAPMPLITLLLAHLVTRDEKLDRWKFSGCALGILGVIVLIGADKLVHLGEDGVRQIAVVAASCCFAINVVCNRGLTGGSPFGNVTAVMIVSALMLAPLGMISSWQFSPSAASILAMALMVVFTTCIATVLQLQLIGRQGAAFSAQVNFLVPLFGLGWGLLLLAEKPSVRSLIGLALILGGVAVSRRGAVLRR